MKTRYNKKKFLFRISFWKSNIHIKRLKYTVVDGTVCGHKSTNLHYATRIGNKNLVKVLLELGVKMHLEDKEGNNPLHLASKNGNLNLVKIFIARGININALTKSRFTSLHLAVKYNKYHVVQQLLQNHAEVNTHNSTMDTPLHDAVKTKSIELVKLLLNHGASLQLKNASGETALHLACRFGCKEMVKLLLELKPNREARTSNGSMSLHYAVKNLGSAAAIAQVIVESDINIEAEDDKGRTAIMIAAKQNWCTCKIIEYLLSMGAQVKNERIKRFLKQVILKDCRHCGYYICLHWLDRGLMDVGSRLCRKTLRWAVRYNVHAVFDLLIARKASPHQRNKSGKSLLLEAVAANNLYAARVLLKSGTCPNDRDSEGTSALRLAVCTSEKMCQLLLDYNADERNILHFAIESKDVGIVRSLVEKGAKVNAVNDDGESAFFYAYKLEAQEIVWYLLIRGVDLKEFLMTFEHSLKNDYHDNVCSSFLIMYINVLDSLNHIDEDYISKTMVPSEKFIEQQMCKENLQKMRSMRVYDKSRLTYYDLLTKRPDALAHCLRNKTVRLIVTHIDNYCKNVLLYPEIVKLNVSEGLRRLQLMEECQTLLHRALGGLLPYEAVCLITDFLPNSDLSKCIYSLTSIIMHNT